MRAITTILALIGLAAVLTHPQARRGAHILLEVCGSVGSALSGGQQTKVASLSGVAVSSAAVTGYIQPERQREDIVAPEPPLEGSGAEEAVDVSPTEKTALPAEDSDLSKVLKIYEDSENRSNTEG